MKPRDIRLTDMASLLCNLPNHQERNAQCRAVAVIQCIIHQITDITWRNSSKAIFNNRYHCCSLCCSNYWICCSNYWIWINESNIITPSSMPAASFTRTTNTDKNARIPSTLTLNGWQRKINFIMLIWSALKNIC